MAHTFSKIYIHAVFAVKKREPLIVPAIEEDVYRYITGIVQNKQQKLIAINGISDHIHLAIGIKPTCCISDLIREVKKSSTSFIRTISNQQTFSWQEGFGAFSAYHKSLDDLVLYIQHQKEHHLKISSAQEFDDILKEYGLDTKTDQVVE